MLGPVEVLVDGRRLRLDSGKQRALLSFLAIHVGEVQSTDRIIDALWGEESPKGGAKTLQFHVSKLRSALHDAADCLVTRSPGYVLAVPPEAIDRDRFERLLAEARAVAPADPARASLVYDEALSLWRGTAFADFEYEEFVQTEARRLEELRLSAIEDRGRSELAAGHHRELVGNFEALVAEHPLRERMRAVLMVALYRSGRHADAVEEYDRFHKLLVEQGLVPSTELETLMHRILEQDAGLMAGDPFAEISPVAAPTEVRNPFKGLRAFTEEDAADFFGRGDLVQRAAERLLEPGLPGRFLVLIGPSGSGKSSLVRAGLVPALRRGVVVGAERWGITTMYPGSDPVGRLEEILEATDPAAPQLLIIDQFEEAFVLNDRDTQASFLEVIEELVGSRRPIRVVCTLRADFMDRPLSHPTFARLVDAGLMLVTPLSDDDVRDAVTEPAHSVGVHVEPELTAAIIGDVASRAATLPLLQYTLTELFDHRRSDVLTLDAYRAAGGISGALARRADHTFTELDAAEREAARQVFVRLVTVTAEAEHLRRRVTIEELAGLPITAAALEQVLDRFGRQRLLTFDRDPDSGRSTVEVAHEALLREWPRLWDWVESSREDIRAGRRLAASAAEWIEAGRDPEFLPTGTRLSRLQDWADTSTVALTAVEHDYLDSAAARATEHARRSARRRRLISATFAVAAVVAIVLAVVAQIQRNRAEDQAELVRQQLRVDEARDLVGEARDVITEDPELSMLLSLEAIDIALEAGDRPVGDAIGSLHQAVLASPWIDTLPGATEVAWSPDGSQMLTMDPEAPHEAALIIDVATGETIHPLSGMVDAGSLAWSSDGRLIAIGDDEGSTLLFDAATGARLPPLPVTMRHQRELDFSRDGRLLAGRNIRGGSVAAVDTDSGERVPGFTGEVNAGWGVAVRPEADLIASVDWGGTSDTIRLWVPETRRTVFEIPAPLVRWIAFSSDGERLAGVSADRTLYVWDVATREELRTIPEAGEGRPAWSPDGSRIALPSGHQAVVWSTTTWEQEPVVYTHPSDVAAVAFSPDALTLATADATKARLWRVGHPRGEVAAFPGHWSAADWLPGGTSTAAIDDAGLVHLLDASTGGAATRLPGTLPPVERILISPDGRYFAMADTDSERAIVFDTVGQESITLPPWAPLDFSGNSRLLAVGNVFGDVGISVYDTASWDEVSGIPVGSRGAVFLPDGRHLLISPDPPSGEAMLWDLVDDAELTRLPLPGGSPARVTIASDGSRIAIAESQTGYIGVWESDPLTAGTDPDDALVREIVGPPGLSDAKLDGDGSQVLTIAGPIFSAFDVATGERLYDIDIGSEILGLSLTADGRHVALPTAHGLYVITTDLQELIDIAEERIGRTLTDDECKTYLLEGTCPDK